MGVKERERRGKQSQRYTEESAGAGGFVPFLALAWQKAQG